MNLQEKTWQIRQDVVTLIHKAGNGYIGGDMSVADILIVLYCKHMNCSPENRNDPNRDRLTLSRGHCVEALYCILADRGYFSKSDLDSHSGYFSKYISRPNDKVNGVKISSGSSGRGLSYSIGMALVDKMDGALYRVHTVTGDGELTEGSAWEGAMAAAYYKLDNLTAVIDRNRPQISGSTETVMAQDSQKEHWRAFGWHVLSVDGNSTKALDFALQEAKQIKGRPTMITANTTKGCGVSFVENQASWRHKSVDDEYYELAMCELEQKRAAHEQDCE